MANCDMKLMNLFNECWENCTDDEKVEIHNIYASEVNPDDMVYENDEDFFETYFEGRPFEAVRSSYFGKYIFNDRYVWFNGYANLDSSDYIDDLPIYQDEIGCWLIENDMYSEISHISAMEDFCDACKYGIDEDDDEDVEEDEEDEDNEE